MQLLALLPTLLTPAHADDAWATREVELIRWPAAVLEAAPVTAKAAEGDKLVVVLEDGDQVRVQLGDVFGWVPADALTDENPDEGETDAPTE